MRRSQFFFFNFQLYYFSMFVKELSTFNDFLGLFSNPVSMNKPGVDMAPLLFQHLEDY